MMMLINLTAKDIAKTCKEESSKYLSYLGKDKLTAEEAITFILGVVYENNLRERRTLISFLVEDSGLLLHSPRNMRASFWKCIWYPSNYYSITNREEARVLAVHEWLDSAYAGIVSKDDSLQMSMLHVIVAELLPEIAKLLKDERAFSSIYEKYLAK